jgi:hypothetical protein
MRERLSRVAERLAGSDNDASPPTRLTALRAAAAELLIAATVEAAYDRLRSGWRSDSETGIPVPLSWAPLLIAPLTAAAHVQHARQPDDSTTRALRLLNTATVAVGGALLLYEFIDSSHSPRRLGPLGLASAGLLGFAIDRQEREIHRNEAELRRRARVVERLVPQRRTRFDRVVVHV